MMMEDESPPPPPAPVMISQPSPGQVASESAAANLAATKDMLNSGVLGQYAQQLTDIQKSQSPQLSQINLEQQKTYGPQLIQAALDNLKLSDPTGFAVRDQLGQKALQGLSPEQFGKLSPQEQRQAEQDIRAGQVSRGGGTGIGDSLDEAISKYNLGRGLQQQQLSNAGSFLNGSTPQSSFASLNQAGQTAPVGTQNVQQFSQGLFPSTNQLISNQAQNFGTMADFTGRQNALANNQFQYNDQNTSNPFVTGLSAFGGFAGQVLGGAGGTAAFGAMCWVAREVYGVDNPRWELFRHWLLNYGPKWLLKTYLSYGERFAQFISNKPMLKYIIRKLMDSRIESMMKEKLCL